ncbi:stage II sporulation protein M [Staphylococcus debuckii]|uniref:stage II sporulation protein M n=1 Tax=Staphylococcus debuckii TaxID=2044912 RepID=UPI000F42D775|nr:stage II sporulation protein M [Staphylococcus debuckii]AYU54111.1 stage II sporulation protein M [Staphylococcus debuckii]
MLSDSTYLKRALKIFLLMTCFLILGIILAYIFHPSFNTLKSIGDKIPEHLNHESGLHKVWGFIYENGLRVPSQMFILALIPIPFLYLLNTIFTAVLPGVLLGFLLNFTPYRGFIAVIATIPHYTFEVFGLCIVASGLYKVNQAIIRKITNLFRSNKKENYSLKEALLNLIKAFVLIGLPLIIIAAFLETYVSEWIFKIFT